MGAIAVLVEGLIRQGAKGREIIAAIAKAEEEQKPQPLPKTHRFKADFDIWYAVFPHKIGKADALKAFTVAASKATLEQLVAGVHRYIADKPADRPWCNPGTWLRQERWNDVPGVVVILSERRRTPADAARELLAEMEGLQNGRHRTENLGTGAVALGFSTAKPS